MCSVKKLAEKLKLKLTEVTYLLHLKYAVGSILQTDYSWN